MLKRRLFWLIQKAYVWFSFSLLFPPLLSVSVQITRQLSALTLYRCEQSVLDYCHAHLSLHLNVGMESPTQALGGQRPARYHPGLVAALPSEPVLPCPQTHFLHQ